MWKTSKATGKTLAARIDMAPPFLGARYNPASNCVNGKVVAPHKGSRRLAPSPLGGVMAKLVDPQLRASNEGLLRPRVPRARGIDQLAVDLEEELR